MMYLAIAILMLSVSGYSHGEYYRRIPFRPIPRDQFTHCIGPDGPVSIDSTYVKVKSLRGANGISLPGKYNCRCLSGGVTYCTAFDIPCNDSAGNLADLGETFKTNIFGGEYSCICRRGRGRFDTCVPQTSATSRPTAGGVGCTDKISRKLVQTGQYYVLQSSGRLFQCRCGGDGSYEPGSCRSYTSRPTKRPTVATGCIDHVDGTTVQVGAKYRVRNRALLLYLCTCGANGRHEPGTCSSAVEPGTNPTTQPAVDQCGGCDENSECNHLGRGLYRCECRNGFRRTGRTTCTDINECTQYSYRRGKPCGDNAVCVNTPGSYRCECDEGFTGDGTTCSLLDHCTENLATCDINARCISSATSYQCICNEGYEGDGESCTKTDACAGQTECDVNAKCQATTLSYNCICLDGYDGNGLVCRKMCWDEIANQFVARESVFLRLNPVTGQQEGCTCGVGGVSVPGSCVGPEPTSAIPQPSTTSSTTTTTSSTTTPAQTSRSSQITCRKGRSRISVGVSYNKIIRGESYICTCYNRRGRGITRCRGAASKTKK